MVKNPPAKARDVGDLRSTPGSGKSPGEGNGSPLQYSCLEHSMDRGAWWATVHGVTRSQTWPSDGTKTMADLVDQAILFNLVKIFTRRGTMNSTKHRKLEEILFVTIHTSNCLLGSFWWLQVEKYAFIYILNFQKQNGYYIHHFFSVLTLRHLWNRILTEYCLHITVGLWHSPALTHTLYVSALGIA